MRWTVCLSSAGVILAGVVGVSSAQSYRATTTIPRSTGTYYTPYAVPAPNCPPGQLPSAPGTTVVPYGSSVIPPSSTIPGTTTPGSTIPGATTPSSIPSLPGATPGAPGSMLPGSGDAAAAAAAASAASGAVGERGSDAQASAAPQMLGDLISNGFGRFRPRNGYNSSYYNSASGPRVPAVARSGIKIADNESPRPIDRAFITYNYFNTVQTFGGGYLGLHRGLIGFEKTFLDGDASVGMRLPFLQGYGDGAIGTDGFGDLSLILKYAFYNDRETGDLISGGLVVTAPTGLNVRLLDGSDLNSVLLQPWAGFICNLDKVYTHGFTSLIVPTDSRDVTLYSADVGVGYRLYQTDDDRFLTSIIPTFEGHLNIPFSNAGSTDLFYFPNSVILTGGIHFGLCNTAWLTLGAAIPVTGPQLYDAEFMCQFNLRF